MDIICTEESNKTRCIKTLPLMQTELRGADIYVPLNKVGFCGFLIQQSCCCELKRLIKGSSQDVSSFVTVFRIRVDQLCLQTRLLLWITKLSIYTCPALLWPITNGFTEYNPRAYSFSCDFLGFSSASKGSAGPLLLRVLLLLLLTRSQTSPSRT